ncbi:prephenate dehydratase [Halonatronum saccharophilum]|uniref:prephenate dehydratase n=1 Tax=Halonatronum saccharophilum TaxID=150060 RepID=UPI0004845865|nr:prephenate dehydratase [Halonatronum saccharophilum]
MSSLGFLGPTGTFTELAAKEYDSNIKDHIAYQDIKSLFESASKGEVDKAIVPIENSIQGAVTLTLDLLVEMELKIIGETVIPISHSLLAKNGVSLDEVENIISHPQALAQCRGFLESNVKSYQTHISNSTAEAIQKIQKLEEGWAAIGNSQAADHYELEVIADRIQDNKENWTRFIILSKKESGIDGDHKTSIIFSKEEDHPGGLYDILHEFAIKGINLTRIESRPAKRALGDYIFFIDFEGHYEDDKVKAALDLVQYKTSWYKLLGSYPKAEIK